MHFGCLVPDACIGMSGCIVEEMVDAETEVVPGAGRDGGGDGADGVLHGGVVDGASIVVEETSKFLAEFDLGRCELTNGAGAFGELLFLSVCGGSVWVRGVLGFCW